MIDKIRISTKNPLTHTELLLKVNEIIGVLNKIEDVPMNTVITSDLNILDNINRHTGKWVDKGE